MQKVWRGHSCPRACPDFTVGMRTGVYAPHDLFLLPAKYGFCRCLVIETVVGAYHYYVIVGGVTFHHLRRRFRSGHAYAEVVAFRFGIRQLTDRFDELPVASVKGILRAFNRRKGIGGAEVNVNLTDFLLIAF